MSDKAQYYNRIKMIRLNLEPEGKDFFLRKLTGLGRKWVFVIFIAAYLLASIPILLSIHSGNFNNSNLQIDAIRDIGYYVQFFILLPFFILFFPYYLKGFEKALNALIESGVVTITAEDSKEVEKYSNKLFGHWITTLIPYMMVFLFIIIDISTYILAGKNTWNSASGLKDVSFIEIINIVLIFFLFLLISSLFLRIVLTYFVINKFLTDRVNIQPLNLDNCGGLSPLGDFSLKLTKAGFAIGVPVLIGIISNYYQHAIPLLGLTNILLIGGYMISLSVVFFLPLLGARKSMLTAKKKELKLIGDYLEEKRKNILLNYGKNKSMEFMEISNLEGLMKLYDLAKSMPVFPFNTMNIVRFLGSIIWPLALVVLQLIFGKI